MPVIVLGIRVILVNETVILALMELPFSQGRQKIHNTHLDMDKLSGIVRRSYEQNFRVDKVLSYKSYDSSSDTTNRAVTCTGN